MSVDGSLRFRTRTRTGNHDGRHCVGQAMTELPSNPILRGRRELVAVCAVVAAVAIVLAACSGVPSGSPGPSPIPTSDPSLIDHSAGATDVVLRFEEGGGFVPFGFFATQAPQFTLYGDGTVIFRDSSTNLPPQVGDVMPLTPYAIAKLSEVQVQNLLRFALADSGLGVARAAYHPGTVADAPTATFTVNAGGLAKRVAVEALGIDTSQGPDTLILKALAGLGGRLRNFSGFVNGETAWVPDRFRGLLTEQSFNPPQPQTKPWPWKDVGPGDFVQAAGPDAPQFPIHTLTFGQVQALGIAGSEGGFSGLSLVGPDGKTYTLAVRPLLPDERF